MKTAAGKIKFIGDKQGSIFVETKDGPYRLIVNLEESGPLFNGQLVKVKYEKYGQYATLVK